MAALATLLESVGLPAPSSDRDVTTVEIDSRKCVAGSLFICLPGRTTTGEAHIGDAVARGATCIVTASAAPTLPEDVVVVRVDATDLRGLTSRLSSKIVGSPSEHLRMLGITGTNGKTTVAWLVAEILARTGFEASSLGTLQGQRTTPAPPDLHRQLREVLDRATAKGKPGAVAMEVSSHALDQGRVDGILFDVAVFTNLSHEHLDYHETMEAYFEAKASLFDESTTHAAVICVDDPWGRILAARTAVRTVEVSTSSAGAVATAVGRTQFHWRSSTVTTSLTGSFNVTNALIALEAVALLDVDPADAIAAIGDAPPVPGRLEAVGTGAPRVLVDYAHTPDALERVLRDLAQLRSGGRLVLVFGCGGDRDRAKRPVMGRIATELADVVYATSDNPRSEDPETILDEVLAGASGPAEIHREVDRTEAITEAIAGARDKDLVLLAGKGHETTQEVAGTFLDLDDRTVALRALDLRSATC